MSVTQLTQSQIEARRANILRLLESAGSTFVGVDFVKKDNTVRRMNIQTKAGFDLLVGEAASASAKRAVETRKASHPELLNVYSVDSKGWRSVNLDTVLRLVVKGTTFEVGPVVA